MIKGALIRWDNDRKFGFIQRDDREPDVFVHATGFASAAQPREGLRVEFDITTDEKSGRLRASGVRFI